MIKRQFFGVLLALTVGPWVLDAQNYRTEPVFISPGLTTFQGETDIAIDQNRNIVAIWGGGGSQCCGGNIYMKAFDANVDPITETTRLESTAYYVIAYPQINIVGSQIVTAWNTNNTGLINFSKFGTYDYINGSIVKSWELSMWDSRHLVLGPGSDSTIYAAFIDDRDANRVKPVSGVTVRLGVGLSEVVQLGDHPPQTTWALAPQVIAHPNRAEKVILWTDTRTTMAQLYARTIESDGATPDSSRLISTNITQMLDIGSWNYAAALDSSGRMHVLWAGFGVDGPNIFFRIFDSALVPITEIRNVNTSDSLTYVGHEGSILDFEMLDTGETLAVWSDGRDENIRIYGQWFTSNGDALQSNFPLSPADSLDHIMPSLAVHENMVALAWSAGNSDLPWDQWNHQIQMATFNVDDILGLTKNDLPIPSRITMHPNYPNPFNPTTTIRYELPEQTNAKLVVYNLLGREVARLVDGTIPPGYHRAIWVGRDAAGREVPTGMYIARLVTKNYTKSIKMVLLK